MSGPVNAETPIVKDIQLAASRAGARLLRNNVGALEDKRGRFVTFGLCPGSSDLIGWIPVKITPDMVGQTVAIFTAVEGKTPEGRERQNQKDFIDAVRTAGGRAGFARSVEQAISIIRGEHLG